ncbi:hypothetical protein GO495_13510 [Chitinophaga oryziterrae]|uniref:DUF2975 domain-containing protein n=1 Tax=Chitinophaga oryziterrae TaxID=1031224 RepID=A0A6N8J908_9BACT|nr:hypothetical protein [Chitinophaga oryziterrae]MVT41603.1 hypothetical protein [Chitinophaga oryziterrae]
MRKVMFSKIFLIKIVLWATIFFSAQALIYHIRWFIPFLNHQTTPTLFADKMPMLWFIVQICSNSIFLIVGLLLLNLFRKYQRTGFFDKQTLRVFNAIIYSCLGLALLGIIQTIANNLYEVHLQQWTSTVSVANLALRSFTTLLIFKEPQTMYFLLAIILWSVKQFVTKALIIKHENESFV